MNTNYTLHSEYAFEAAHKLPDHPGKCSQLHGHRWNVTFEIAVAELDRNGMVIDFHELKQLVAELDHTYLNDIIETPTAEQLSLWFTIQATRLVVQPAARISVTVEESPGNAITCNYLKGVLT